MRKQKAEESVNTEWVERIAVNRLESALLNTGLVVPTIPTEDKGPSWDGEIRLYSSQTSFPKRELVGRIPGQVKGTYVRKLQKKAVYQVEVADLCNFFRDGGAIFFVVQIKTDEQYRIFYAPLLRFQLRRLLEQAGNQKTKQISLETFPVGDKSRIVRILSDFLTNREKQWTLLPNVKSLNDLETSGMVVDHFGFSVPGFGLKRFDDVVDELLQHQICIYAKPSGVEANFAVDLIQPEVIVTHQNIRVTVNGEVLYDQIDIIRKPGNIKSFQLGTGIVGSISQNKLNFQYHPCDTLHEQIRQLRLLTALMRGEPVKIGPLVLPCSDFKLTGHTQQELEQRLSWLQTIARVLKQLHVNKDLNLAKMTDEEYQKLRNVVIGIDKGVPVPFSFDGALAYGKIEFGGISVLLNLKKSEDGKGVYLSNFFDMENLKMTAEADQSPDDGFAISPYILMDITLLSELDNVDLNEIVRSVEKQPYSTLYGDRIINLTLELLKLYDQTKSTEVLDICLNLLSFVEQHHDIPEEVIIVNRLQIEKRRRALSAEEKEYLFMLERPGIVLPYQLAASILLESFQEAELIYKQMSEDERKLFDRFPIKNLWRNSIQKS